MKYSMAVIILFILSIAFFMWDINRENNTNPILANHISEGEFSEATTFLLLGRDVNTERKDLGNSGITITANVDFYSEESKKMFEETILHIYETEVIEGKANLRFRYYLEKEELEQRKGRFIFALASYCYIEEEGTNPMEFIQQLFNAEAKNVVIIAKDYGTNIVDCMSKDTPKQLLNDMYETETYSLWAPSIQIGINGQNTEMLLSSSNIDKVKQALREKQISIGQ